MAESIAWHENCLKNRIAHHASKESVIVRDDLINQADKLSNEEYAFKIACAKKERKTTFDMERYKVGKFLAPVVTTPTMAIEKLLAEYEEKIVIAEKTIANLLATKSDHRKQNNELGWTECAREIGLWDSRKQAYIQAKVDIDSLLDYV